MKKRAIIIDIDAYNRLSSIKIKLEKQLKTRIPYATFWDMLSCASIENITKICSDFYEKKQQLLDVDDV